MTNKYKSVNEMKQAIYSNFDKGFNAEQTVVYLNLQSEKRRVSGCYAYYKKHGNPYKPDKCKDKLEEVNNELKRQLEHRIDLVNTLVETIKELRYNEMELAMCKEYDIAAEILKHKIENGIPEEEAIEVLRVQSLVLENRRIVKHLIDMAKPLRDVISSNDLTKLEDKVERTQDEILKPKESGYEGYVRTRMNRISEDTLSLLSSVL